MGFSKKIKLYLSYSIYFYITIFIMTSDEYLEKFEIQPRYDRAVVELIPEEDHFIKSDNLDLIKPDIAKGKAALKYAKVIAFGWKCEQLEKGEIVGFQNGAGIEAVPEDPNCKLMIVRDLDLIMKIDVKNG